MKFPTQTCGKSGGLLGGRPVENAPNSMVRMGRLELPRPLQALEPKSSASANSATSAHARSRATFLPSLPSQSLPAARKCAFDWPFP